jgi:hypothetical protein
MDLAVTDPGLVSDNLKPAFQKIFTKKTSSSPYLPFDDMTSHFLRQLNDVNAVAKFLMKQLVQSSNLHSEDTDGVRCAAEALQQENVQLKQAQSATNLEFQNTIDDLQRQISARNGTITELQHQLEEKENLINKFRKLHGHRVMAGNPPSPRSDGGGNGATMIPLSSHSHRSMQQQPQQPWAPPSRHNENQPPAPQQQQQQQQQPTPLHGFFSNRAEEERHKQQALHSQLHRNAVFAARTATSSSSHPHHSSIPSGMTPIQVPRRSSSYPTTTNINGANSSGSSVVVPNTPRIRDLTSSAGYNFTSTRLNNPYQPSSSSNRQTPPPPPPASRNGPLSPTMAFARNNQGSTRYGSNNNYHRRQGF